MVHLSFRQFAPTDQKIQRHKLKHFYFCREDSDANLKMRGKSEIDFFLSKFHEFLRAGYTAHLDVDANAEKAWVGLRVLLDTAFRSTTALPAC